MTISRTYPLLIVLFVLHPLVGAALTSGASPDCNHNGVADERDVPPLRLRAPRQYVNGSYGTPADFDRDGDTDIVFFDGPSRRLRVMLNRGDGSFAPPTAGPPVPLGAVALLAADLDRDGLPDVAALSPENMVLVFHNLGAATFNPAGEYRTGQTPSAIAAADVDGDLDIDLVVTNSFDSDLSIFENRGDGSFVAAPKIPSGFGPALVAAADLDGDGDTDLAVARSGGLALLIGRGDKTFAPPRILSPVEILSPASIKAGDLDGDGDQDLVITDAVYFQPALFLLRNDGHAGFTSLATFPFVEEVRSATLADFDGDTDLDIATEFSSTRGNSGVALFRNRGGGTFDTPVEIPAGFTNSVTAAELNGDRRTDLLIGMGTGSGGFAVLLNSGDASLFEPGVVAAVGRAPVALTSSDFDADGQGDLAVVNHDADSVTVLIGHAGAVPPTGVTYAVGKAPSAIAAADFSGDGSIDLVIANSDANTVSFLRNSGDGMFVSAVDVAAGRGGRTLQVGDFDKDGNLDLALGAPADQRVVIVRNTGNATFAPPASYPAEGPLAAIATGDFDRDGDLDLATANGFAGDVSILRNGGDGSFAVASHTFVALEVVAIASADFDADGWVDLAVADSDQATVRVLRNLGEARFAAPVRIAVGERPVSLVAGDIDGDGDTDLAVANRAQGLAILRNSGAGVFAPPAHFPVAISLGTTAQGLTSADLDGDGRLDLAAVESFSDRVAVLFNRSPRPTSQDCDDNGVPDECQLTGDDCSHNGVPDRCEPDSDGDGRVDSCDTCAGVDDDIDTDGDRLPDCRDNCPHRANPDQANADADGSGDVCDDCDSDPLKAAPGICGCGVPDTDSDFDRVPNCQDECPTDPLKTRPAICGCGVVDPDCLHPTPTRTSTRDPGVPTFTPAPTPTAPPRTYQVSTTSDDVDTAPGDGRCATQLGTCSLRAAIQEANAHPGRDIIVVPSGTYILTVPGVREDASATGDLDVTDGAEIAGAGRATTVVDGNASDRVIEVLSGADVVLMGLTLQNGQAPEPDFPGSTEEAAGGIQNGGTLAVRQCAIRSNRGKTALSNRGTMRVIDSQISVNQGSDSGGIVNTGTFSGTLLEMFDNGGSFRAGAVWNLGTMTLADCRIMRNAAPPTDGGAILNAGFLTLQRSVVGATFGPGIFVIAGNADLNGCVVADNEDGIVNAGTLVVTNSSIRNNSGNFGNGRGLINEGMATISNTTISGHQALDGAGIRNEGTLELTNSTLSGNAAAGSGGGVLNIGMLHLNNVTIANNTANTDRGSAEGGGLFNSSSGTIEAANTIVAANVDQGGRAPDCSGIVTSRGHNLLESAVGCILIGDSNTVVGNDALLGPLQDNGGATYTHALLATSPAIDAGTLATAGDGIACAGTDQRGVPRPHGRACDIGAYEATVNCGNGQLDAPEACDDDNTENGDCCSASCQFEPPPPQSGDANCDTRLTAADLSMLSQLIGNAERSVCAHDDATGDCALSAEDVRATIDALFGDRPTLTTP